MKHAASRSIAVVGASGMLGQALVSRFRNHAVLHPFTRRDLDITSTEAVRNAMEAIRPDWILHAAAYTRVDDAEREIDEAFRVNALGARNLAAAACEWNATLCYFSTDYVFDGGLDRPYRELDSPRPVNVYGRSKLAGEVHVRDLCPRHLIIRTSWLFGPGGSHFPGKILALARCRKVLEVVNDQRGSPTYTRDLAEAVFDLVGRGACGTYHVTNSGSASWWDVACEVVRHQGIPVEVRTTDSSRFVAPAPRPASSVLDNYWLRLEGVPALRHWKVALADFLDSLGDR